jgi:segregation and condensation protein A
VYEADLLGVALGNLLRIPPRLDTSHIRPTVSIERRLEVLRDLLGSRARVDFDESFGAEDRLTQAVTIFALLELHKKGEATWNQRQTFGPIEILAGEDGGSVGLREASPA